VVVQQVVIMRDTTKVTAVALMVLWLLFGCGYPQPKSAEPQLDQATVDMITNTGGYPDRQYHVALVDMALTERCMRAAGISWRGQVDEPNPDADAGGAVSVDWVRRHGYGLSDGNTNAGQPQQPTSDDARLRTTLLGPRNALAKLVLPNKVVYWYPRTGCAAQAHIAVYGDLDTWARISYLPQEINLVLFNQVKADERYQAALQAWRDCMKQLNYSYVTPSDISSALAGAYRTDAEPLPQRKAKEIALALQDLGCNQQAYLSRTALQLRREYAQTIDPAQRAEMARLSTLFDEAERRSHALDVSTFR
jgi:hypothetical protein